MVYDLKTTIFCPCKNNRLILSVETVCVARIRNGVVKFKWSKGWPSQVRIVRIALIGEKFSLPCFECRCVVCTLR